MTHGPSATAEPLVSLLHNYKPGSMFNSIYQFSSDAIKSVGLWFSFENSTVLFSAACCYCFIISSLSLSVLLSYGESMCVHKC